MTLWFRYRSGQEIFIEDVTVANYEKAVANHIIALADASGTEAKVPKHLKSWVSAGNIMIDAGNRKGFYVLKDPPLNVIADQYNKY